MMRCLVALTSCAAAIGGRAYFRRERLRPSSGIRGLL